MSAFSGLPGGCQPFTILDPGAPQGRPDTDGQNGGRVLRGYAIAFAVDNFGHEISWNHLSGAVDIVNYADRSAWEYNAYAFQAINPSLGAPTDGQPGCLHLDGVEYDYSFDKLLFDFYAVGSQAFSQGGFFVMLDTDLTLYPVSVDLRQDNEGPVTTKAKFDIWNQNEDGFSGTTRCITCWDQTLLSNYGPPNHFLIGNLQTNKGKARIDGITSPDVCGPYSVNAAILGVADKILAFSGGGTGRTDAGMTLVGQGQESAQILRDIIAPPGTLTTPTQEDGTASQPAADPSLSSMRQQSRSQSSSK
jgi:hypothetical protein